MTNSCNTDPEMCYYIPNANGTISCKKRPVPFTKRSVLFPKKTIPFQKLILNRVTSVVAHFRVCRYISECFFSMQNVLHVM